MSSSTHCMALVVTNRAIGTLAGRTSFEELGGLMIQTGRIVAFAALASVAMVNVRGAPRRCGSGALAPTSIRSKACFFIKPC